MSTPQGPDLSVIIACFNDGDHLLEAVESTEHGSRGRHEIIIVDDGSTDQATLASLNHLTQRGFTVLRQANAGPAAARNTGIRQARGRYILPLDADNRLRPAYIERGIAELDSDPSVDVVYGDPEYFGGRTGRRRVDTFSLARLAEANYIDTCAVFRRSAWERLEGYDEAAAARGIEDWDFWIRLGASGSGFRHLDEVLFDYRVRSGSLTDHLVDPERRATAMQYLYGKRLEITVGQFIATATWDYAVNAFRGAPVRTLVRLVVRAYFQRLRQWWQGMPK